THKHTNVHAHTHLRTVTQTHAQKCAHTHTHTYCALKSSLQPSVETTLHHSSTLHLHFYILSFSRRFYPKRLTYVRLTMYTHFTFTLMAHCTSGVIRGSVSCSRTLRQGIELATFCLLNDFFTSCTTVAPMTQLPYCFPHQSMQCE